MDRVQYRKAVRERVNKREKALAKAMGMPKGLRQYFKRFGTTPSTVAQEYRKWGGYTETKGLFA
jgi:hypothetical protein